MANESSRIVNAFRNTAFGIGAQGIEMVLKFVGRTVFLLCLSEVYLGASNLFYEILTALSLAELGIGSAIAFALYKPIRENDETKIAALMGLYKKAYVTIGLTVAAIGLVLVPFLKYIIKDPGELEGQIIPIFLFYLFNASISYFYSYKSALLVADQKNYIVQIVKEITSILRTVFQVLVLVLTKNFYLYLAIESIFILINNIGISVYVDRKYSYCKTIKDAKLDKETKSTIWKNVRALISNKIGNILVNSTDNTLISALVGISTTGLYANYSMFTTMFRTFLGQIFSNLFAGVGNLNAEGDTKKSYGVFSALQMLCFWIYGFASIGLMLTIQDVITVWIGKEYLLPDILVLIITVNFFITGMMSAVWVFKDTYGLFKYGKYMCLVTAVLNLAFSWVLGVKFGLTGILAATVISRSMTGLWYDPWALFKHGFHMKLSKYFIQTTGYVLITVAILIAAWFATKWMVVDNILMLILKIILISLVVNLLFIIIFWRTASFKYLLGAFSKFIPSKIRNKFIKIK